MIDFNADVENCLGVLRSGGVIVYPSDTLWGLGCDATNADAVNRIYRLKQRQEDKKMIVLLADERDILTYVTEPEPQVFEFLKTVTKPTTVIYEGAIGIAENLVSDDGTVAIRIVKEPFCRHLIKRFRKPLVSTSANLSGVQPPVLFRDIPSFITAGVDYVVKYRQEDHGFSSPSQIVTWDKDGTLKVLRP